MGHSKRKDRGAATRDLSARKLPKKLRRKIMEDIVHGVTYTLNWRDCGPDVPLRVTAIHWRPGDHNELAACVIKKVHGPMPLELDGHWYTITPSEAPSETG